MTAPTVTAPPSLLDLFDPPEGYLGRFGWLCGYSADAGFLDAAAGRFTGQSQGRRAREGAIALAAILDPQNGQILPSDAPGVLHLPIRGDKSRPFSLLHAKVAVLGFRGQADDALVRLIVSTGNWTEQTIEESLDLHWRVDVGIHALRNAKRADIPRVACADVLAAWRFLGWARRFSDSRIVSAKRSDMRRSMTLEAAHWLIAQMGPIKRGSVGSSPRFFDNRRKAMLPQIPAMVTRIAGDVRRNRLVVGSGFFESAKNQPKDKSPEVIDRVVSTLQGSASSKGRRLLSQSPALDLFVNPHECQAVATGSAALVEAGWTIRPAHTADFFKGGARRLHAKFIFSANSRDRSDSLSSAWIYLGSANVTARGLTMPASREGGNLEAGVILSVADITLHDIAMRLPVQFDEQCDPTVLKSGSDLAPPNPKFFACPVSYFLAESEGRAIRLRAFPVPEKDITLLNPDGRACAAVERGLYAWPHAMPRTVRVQWKGSDAGSEIPVVDQFGRIAAGTITFPDIEDAWSELASFPLAPPDDDPTDGGDEGQGSGGSTSQESQPPYARYPIRALMEFVENIADRQTQLSPSNWMSWCNRLEQTLASLDPENSAVRECRRLGLNMLSPLRQSAFRPAFTTSPTSPAAIRYDAALRRIMISLKIEHLPDVSPS